jgi:hypothetical protein
VSAQVQCGEASDQCGEQGSVGPVEVIAADLRDTSTPERTEKADPAVRRRVPPPDVTTAAFDRAHRLLVDVAALAAEPEPEGRPAPARNSPASIPMTCL